MRSLKELAKRKAVFEAILEDLSHKKGSLKWDREHAEDLISEGESELIRCDELEKQLTHSIKVYKGFLDKINSEIKLHCSN